MKGIDADCTHLDPSSSVGLSRPPPSSWVQRRGNILPCDVRRRCSISLSELRQRDDWIDDYREQLAAWATNSISAVAAWSLDDFWNVVHTPSVETPSALLTRWRELGFWPGRSR